MYIRLIPHYLVWHYTNGFRDYFRVSGRILQAIIIVFSLRLMFRTFFQPFERLGEAYHGGISSFVETFIVNTLMRLVGMVVRLCVIAIGVLALFFAVMFCIVGIVAWIILPAALIYLLYISVMYLIEVV